MREVALSILSGLCVSQLSYFLNGYLPSTGEEKCGIVFTFYITCNYIIYDVI